MRLNKMRNILTNAKVVNENSLRYMMGNGVEESKQHLDML